MTRGDLKTPARLRGCDPSHVPPALEGLGEGHVVGELDVSKET